MCHKTHAYWDISILKEKKKLWLARFNKKKKKKSVSFFVVVIIIIIIALYLSVNVFSMKG